MKKILFFITSLDGGGAEKALTTLVNKLAEREYNITIYTLFGGGVYEKHLNPQICLKSVFRRRTSDRKVLQYFYLIRNKVFCLLSGDVIYKKIIKEKYDYEIAYVEGFATKIISGSNQASKKYAWVHCNPILLPYSTNAFRSIGYETECYSKFDRIFSVSEDVQESFLEKYKLSSNVIHNCIDSAEIVKMSEEFVEEYDGQAIKLVAVGRLVPVKGFERLIRVLNRLIMDGINVTLEIVGKGEKEKELKQLAKDLHIEEFIRWRGFVENPYPIIKNSDVFVCSSFSEGFSTVVIEALVLGIPVVTTDCSGMREIFDESGCGIIVDNSETGLYDGLKKVLQDEKMLKNMKNKAEERGRNFSVERQVNYFISEINR